MFGFLPTKPLEKFLQWIDAHHVFLILPLSGILLSLGMFAYVHFRTPPEPEPFTLAVEKGDYCYIDVQLLSDWLLKTTGSEADSFYLAVGADETLCIVSMNDVIHENFADIAAYSNAGAEDSSAIPPPFRATGMVKPMTQENMEWLIESLDSTEDAYKALVGSCYLDLREGPNGNLMELFIYVFGASLVLLVINVIVAFDDRRERRRQGGPAGSEP